MTIKEETKIVNKIQEWVTKNGGKVIKMHGSAVSRSGEPDLFGGMVYRGIPIHFTIEIKVPGKKPDTLQFERLMEWRQQGFLAAWADSLETFIGNFDMYVDYIEEARREERRRTANQRHQLDPGTEPRD